MFQLRQWSLTWRRRSQVLAVAIVGCLALLIVSSRGMRMLAQPDSTPSEHPTTVVAPPPDLGRHFKNLGLEGSSLIYDLKNNRTYEHNPQRNVTAFRPALQRSKFLTRWWR